MAIPPIGSRYCQLIVHKELDVSLLFHNKTPLNVTACGALDLAADIVSRLSTKLFVSCPFFCDKNIAVPSIWQQILSVNCPWRTRFVVAFHNKILLNVTACGVLDLADRFSTRTLASCPFFRNKNTAEYSSIPNLVVDIVSQLSTEAFVSCRFFHKKHYWI